MRQGRLNYEARIDRERSHFNRIADQARGESIKMSEENIRRYSKPPSGTPYPLEFAFHLLGDLHGKTVVDFGCGHGLNTVILAALGASVIGVDISEKSLALTAARVWANIVDPDVRLVHADASRLPLANEIADKVLCAATLHHVDVLSAASEIHRVLKPRGVAVFLEPMAGPYVLRLLKRLIPKGPGVSPDEQPLTTLQILAVNKLVGLAGRRREFGLTSRVICRMGSSSRFAIRASHRLDAWLLANLGITRLLASPLVWEVMKLAVDHNGSI